jgi:hypothetical protein
LPQITERLAFGFQEGAEGWIPFHHITDLTTRDGALVGEIIGHDPFLCRPLLRVRGIDAPVVRLRLGVTAGQVGQFYWSTEAAPGFSEERVLTFPLNADGQFHEYVLKVGQHPAWAGQIITAVRLDPGNGARAASFALDFIRAERP